VDAAISVDAYAARRTIRGWVVGAEYVQALAAPKMVAIGIAPPAESDAVEERLQHMVAAAPRASRRVRKAVRAAHALYYAAKGPGPQPPKSLDDLRHRPQNLIEPQKRTAFGDLQECLARLSDAIDPEVRDK
jgi:hypothetical protein